MKFLFDLFPVILFFVAYKSFDIFVATAVAIAASAIQVALFWIKNRRFEKMHLITLGLISVLGGATLIFQDALFIKWKVTVVNWIFGLVFIGSSYIGEKPLAQRMMGGSVTLPTNIWTRLNWSWGIFFILVGFINIYVAFYYGLELDEKAREEIWVNFKLFGVMGLTFAFVIAQAFYMTRHIEEETELASSEASTEESEK
ncbi:MAG: septation protein A [Gammaproteobacteria bacterium]|jgi:intracellular septation protein|nr:septation protein A [Gammaproteobacteria bacterium]MBT4607232.1 septation protein A [Thiotrichales bacterium]MBT3472802.1 septation protein A [Gammaproteobacteria bacterium]MBT3967572.1 septation protein A [Gammaproteobacteria bacterium]MBT4080052.1 septation protein A [Gammaproteobacteria bacterium]